MDFIRDSSLVLWLPLYELDGASFMSRDAYGHKCTVTGATWTPWGRDFNSATPDYVETTCTQLNFTSASFSIIARIRIDNLTNNNHIFVRGAHNADGYLLYVGNGGHIFLYTCQSGAAQVTYSSAGDITTGNWFTVGISRVGASIKIYKNGVDATDTVGTHINPTTCSRTAKIGVHDDKSSEPFDGKIEFLAVWNRALTSLEQMNIHQKIKSERGYR